MSTTPAIVSIGERRVVVGAMRADGKHFGAAMHQQYLFGADVSDEIAVDEIGE